MFSAFLKVIKEHKFAIVISIILFIIPFFWLKPGEMDLGGDGNRLYFYDPITYLKNANLYYIDTAGMGMFGPRHYEIPYVGLIAFLKIFLSSPTLLIDSINGLKLAISFVAIYLIVFQLAKQIYSGKSRYTSIAAILAGIFYVVSLESTRMSFDWETALITHNQIFLNPLIFYFIFKFLLTRRYAHLSIAVLISFVFAPNFSYSGSPPFFAFYPLAFLFLFTYMKFFLKKPILKEICVAVILFLGIHAFHLLSQILNLFDNNSTINTSVFSSSSAQQDRINFFTAVSPSGMAILNLLLPPENILLRWTSFIAPIVVIIGFILNKKKEFLLISLFFILTFFLVTANITNVGLEFYKSLFHISVFSMFRYFYIKWLYVFLFFYTLLFALSIKTILLKLKPRYVKLFCYCVFILLVITGIPLFLGWSINKTTIPGSDNVKFTFKMDPKFERTLQFIRSLPDDGKFLVLPLTDFDSQLVYGKDGGAYAGPPILRFLTTKYGFYGDRNFGWQETDPVKYTELIKKYVREKNYDRLLSIFTTLNIRYIFHNSDPNVYETKFSDGGPWYFYIKNTLPNTQQGYKDFIQHFPVHQIYKNGSYVIYELDKSVYNSTIFIPDGVYKSSHLSFDQDKIHAVFIDKNICNKDRLNNICEGGYRKPNVDIRFTMINPTLYAVTLQPHEKIDSLLLVMQHTFHDGWKVISNGRYIAEDMHFPVNGYANGWMIKHQDITNVGTNVFYIEFEPQKYFWYGWGVTFVSLVIVIALLVFSLVKKQHKIFDI